MVHSGISGAVTGGQEAHTSVTEVWSVEGHKGGAMDADALTNHSKAYFICNLIKCGIWVPCRLDKSTGWDVVGVTPVGDLQLSEFLLLMVNVSINVQR